MNYPLTELSAEEFENIVVSICEEILGVGTIVFSTGKDGGRDAKFTGTANNFPSQTAPWDGRFIIQAKHTVKASASCSESDFKSTLKNEVESIKSLKDDEKLDYYLERPDLCLKIAQNGMKKYLIHFHPDKQIQQLLNVIFNRGNPSTYYSDYIVTDQRSLNVKAESK